MAVSDTGSGIDVQVIDRIFDPYFTTKRMGEGTGLGLAIVKEVIEQHGGTIRVESGVGLGTCFEILLPIASEVDQADRFALESA